MSKPCSRELGNLPALKQDARKSPSLFSPSHSYIIHLLNVSLSRSLFLILLTLRINFISDLTTFNFRINLFHSVFPVILLKHCPKTFSRGNLTCLWFLPIYHRTKSKSLSLVHKTFINKATYYLPSHSSDLANADLFPQNECWSPNMVLSTFLTCSSCTSSCHILLQSFHWSKSFIL